MKRMSLVLSLFASLFFVETATASMVEKCDIEVEKFCRVLDNGVFVPPAEECVILSDGAEVEYTYEIINVGISDIENITVIDDVLGEIPGSPIVFLAPGETVTLPTTAFIDQDTTNTVVAVGDTVISGEKCMAMDSVDVFIADEDGDGVPDNADLCPETIIPEDEPTKGLGNNRWTLGDDGNFIQAAPQAGTVFDFSIEDTGGCSCAQIIDLLGAGKGHLKNGCSTSLMLQQVDAVSNSD